MPVRVTPPYTPLLYSKTGVYKGIHFFLIFSLKHRLWVLVRTASCFEQKIRKKNHNFHLKIIIFIAVKYCSNGAQIGRLINSDQNRI